jgi:thiamine-phosphate pyrophosphorylase
MEEHMSGYRFSKNEIRRAMELYAVTDRRWLAPGQTLADAVREALEGGATFVQLREKELDAALIEAEAGELKTLCREYGVPFVLDDDVELAAHVGADGVHVGQEDMEAGRVRALLGDDAIVGVSAETVEEAVLAEKNGADYLGVGAVFPTGSKDDAVSVSLDTLKQICGAVSIPVIAIGGITKDNVAKLRGTGIAGIAVISAIFAQPDIRRAAEALKENVRQIL